MAKKAGFSCVLFRGEAGAIATTEAGNTATVTMNLSADSIDVTTRAAKGWRQYIQGLKNGSVDITIYYDTEDDTYTAFNSAFLGGTAISLFISDGEGNGLDGDFIVSGYTQNEPLEDKVSIDITVNLTDIGGRNQPTVITDGSGTKPTAA